MTKRLSTADAAGRFSTMLRWTLQRDRNVITCQLDARDSRSCELTIVPHWAPDAAIIQEFDQPLEAFIRYADVARRLRDEGWLVIDQHAAAAHAAM